DVQAGAHMISGGFLRDILSSPLNAVLDARPIAIVGARIAGGAGVDLSSLTVPNALTIWDSEFPGPLTLAGSTWLRDVSFQGSTFKEKAVFANADFRGSLYLGNEPVGDRNRPEKFEPARDVP